MLWGLTLTARGQVPFGNNCGFVTEKVFNRALAPRPAKREVQVPHNPASSGIGPLFTTNLLRNPLDGHFTVESDRSVIEPVLVKCAERFAE